MIVLYTRPGCHLCDEARARLFDLRGSVPGFELSEVNIEDDERLHARYVERIPVVVIGGRIVSELVLDEDAVRSELDTVAA